MDNRIYLSALNCKNISKESIDIVKKQIHYNRLLLTDHTVKGAVEEYLSAARALCEILKEKYPDISYELKLHIDSYRDDCIVHYSAMKTIVECVLSMEKPHVRKIFISHSSKDVELIKEFSDKILQLGIGLSPEDIFCTSIEGMDIKNGEDIRKHIRDNIKTSDFSFLMISNDYKKSEICLNEMGAVWATDNRVRYYILPESDFEEIGWLCDTKKAERIDDAIALDSLEEEITTYYGMHRKGTLWSRQRQGFLDYLNYVNLLSAI